MKVSLVRSQGFSEDAIKRAVFEALDSIEPSFSPIPVSVLIKLNLCYYWDYSTGETSDPRVISALIDYIRERVNERADIALGDTDASAMKTKHAFRMLGFEKLAQDKNVRLVNLSTENVKERETVVGRKPFKLLVSDLLMDTDLVVNAAKLKYHRTPKMTCAMKNIFGAIGKPRKFVYHKKILHETIVAINKIVKPDINLVDGIIAVGKHPKKMGVLLASEDRVSVDFVASRILGYKPKSIKYLRLAKKEKLGPIGPIELIEKHTTLKETRKAFPKVNNLIQRLAWGFQISGVKLYAKIMGDIVPPMIE
ncbi:MAG: DUF362 domain-containing protein [Candidatus Heimdallarchaeota archaeon]